MSDIVVKIEVTTEDIREGIEKDCEKCAVARAMSRVCVKPMLVTGSHCEPADSWETWNRAIPGLVSSWIDELDAGLRVSPISFRQPLPREYVRPEFWPAEVQS